MTLASGRAVPGRRVSAGDLPWRHGFHADRHLDRWDADGVRFVFGCDVSANLIAQAEALPARAWTRVTRPTPSEVETTPRQRPVNVKAATIVARGFKNLELAAEAVAEFPYRPTWCRQTYRMVVLCKNDRCDQENLIAQLKHGVGATRMPVDTLLSNWAYMVMAALVWTVKARFALLLPETGRWATTYRREKRLVLRMEFKRS